MNRKRAQSYPEALPKKRPALMDSGKANESTPDEGIDESISLKSGSGSAGEADPTQTSPSVSRQLSSASDLSPSTEQDAETEDEDDAAERTDQGVPITEQNEYKIAFSFMADYIQRMFNTPDEDDEATPWIKPQDRARFKELSQTSHGRLAFAKALDGFRDKREWSSSAFENLAAALSTIFHQVLLEQEWEPAATLMHMCFTFFRKDNQGRKLYLYENEASRPVWKNYSLWKAALIELVEKDLRQHSSAEHSADLDIEQLRGQSTFNQLMPLLENMRLLQVPSTKFVEEQIHLAGVDSDYAPQLLARSVEADNARLLRSAAIATSNCWNLLHEMYVQAANNLRSIPASTEVDGDAHVRHKAVMAKTYTRLLRQAAMTAKINEQLLRENLSLNLPL